MPVNYVERILATKPLFILLLNIFLRGQGYNILPDTTGIFSWNFAIAF